MTIYFARHGQSRANTEKVFSNRVGADYPLTDLGFEQAEDLLSRIQNASISKIYCSPLLRARQTSDKVAGGLNVVVDESDALREYDLGVLEEKPYSEEALRLYQENERQWLELHNFEHRMEGGESFIDIRNRFEPFVQELMKCDADTVLLMGHGGLYRCMFPIIFDNFSFEEARQYHMDYCDIVEARVLVGGQLTWVNKFDC